MDKFDELLKIIENLDSYLSNLFSRLDINIPSVQKEIYDRLFKFIDTLSYSKGKLRPIVENISKLKKFKLELENMLYESKNADKIIQDFISGIKESTIFINSYFSTLLVNFSANTDFLPVFQKSVIDETVELLLGTGLYQNLLEPAKQILIRNITTGASYKDLQNEMLSYLESTTKRYVKQITTDAIMTYERSYIMNLSNDLELDFFLYQGTKIETTRPFCRQRAGKAFRRIDVESWAYLDWKGKRNGTNKSNIFEFVGGYGCLHRLLPISKEIYNFVNK